MAPADAELSRPRGDMDTQPADAADWHSRGEVTNDPADAVVSRTRDEMKGLRVNLPAYARRPRLRDEISNVRRTRRRGLQAEWMVVIAKDE